VNSIIQLFLVVQSVAQSFDLVLQIPDHGVFRIVVHVQNWPRGKRKFVLELRQSLFTSEKLRVQEIFFLTMLAQVDLPR
jgi:hypothetical protein